ncbi:MAG: TIGR02677 family protein [Eubacteriales bacterium]|nr:TIGR02677 family protein [Eubacteriales bacterium]
MMAQQDLESISQTKYLSAENYIQYRAIMRVFFQEHQKMHYQLDKKALMPLLHQFSQLQAYTEETLNSDLDQLVAWKNLTPIQDPRKAYTISDFKNRQYQYMMTQAALEVERMATALENLYTRTVGLSSHLFYRLQGQLRQIDQLGELPLKQVNAWWQDLQEDFTRLSQSHQDYLQKFYSPTAENRMDAAEFVAYKQRLIHYLEEFIQELQRNTLQIASQLETVTAERRDEILERILQSELEIPRPEAEKRENWQEELRARNLGVWQSLCRWFVGNESTANQVMEVTNEVIRRVVQNAAFLVQMQNVSVSNKAELQHFLRLFSQCRDMKEAHCLSSQVFGAQQARHYCAVGSRDEDRIDLSTYEEAPADFALEPRIRTYKPRMDRSGFADKGAEKERERALVLQRQRYIRQQVQRYIQNGVLDFDSLQEPVSREIRTVFLSWIAHANLSPDGKGRTEYGQAFTLHTHGSKTCRLQCEDGELTLPSYFFQFEEEPHE